MKNESMTLDQWKVIPDNPIQRDTEAHAKKALRTHLSLPSKSHARVAAARLPNGSLVKLDGHTRCLLWVTGALSPPASIECDVYDVANMAEAIELYKEFDNPGAAEGAMDRLTGAYRLNEMRPLSRLLRSGGITTALGLLNRKPTAIYESVRDWKPELEQLDSLGASSRALPAPIIAAALLSLRVRGPKALNFWRLLVDGGGTRIDGRSDGVDALARLLADWRARGQLAGTRLLRNDQMCKSMSCCESWLFGRTVVGVKATNLEPFFQHIELHPRTRTARRPYMS
jgi:hypothetical protein